MENPLKTLCYFALHSSTWLVSIWLDTKELQGGQKSSPSAIEDYQPNEIPNYTSIRLRTLPSLLHQHPCSASSSLLKVGDDKMWIFCLFFVNASKSHLLHNRSLHFAFYSFAQKDYGARSSGNIQVASSIHKMLAGILS